MELERIEDPWGDVWCRADDVEKLEESHDQLMKSLEWIYAKITKDAQYFNNDEVYQWYLSACIALSNAEKVKK